MNLKEKREIAQSQARDKTAKLISGLVPGGASVYELYKAIEITSALKEKGGMGE